MNLRKRPHKVIGRLILIGCCVWTTSSPGVQGFVVPTTVKTQQSLVVSSSSRDLPPLGQDKRGKIQQQTENPHHQPSRSAPRDVTNVLLSYRSNIRRQDQAASEADAKKPLWSLVHFFEAAVDDNQNSDATINNCTPEVLTETVLPALHGAARRNDYRLLLRLWEAVQTFVHHNHNNNNLVTALPRLLGETLTALGRTSASLSKIKRVWQQAVASDDLASLLTARETNTYLKVIMGSRSPQPRAVLSAWQRHRHVIRTSTETNTRMTNAYSLALVLQALTQSVSADTLLSTTQSSDTDFDDDGVSTPLYEWRQGTNAWQWVEAVSILEQDYLVLTESDLNGDENDPIRLDWTPPVVTALLQLNNRLGQVDRRHPTASLALSIWEFFTENPANPLYVASPDMPLVTAVLQCLGDQYRAALALWEALPTKYGCTPNVYGLAAVLACCAKAGAYDVAWRLLESSSSSHGVAPNTVVYNTVLSALVAKRRKPPACAHLTMALDLVSRMLAEDDENDDNQAHLSVPQQCFPDTVTYNTLLQVAAQGRLSTADWHTVQDQYGPRFFGYPSASWSLPERFVHTILDRMETDRISRTSLTYRHAIGCLRSFQGVMQVVGRALQDPTLDDRSEVFDSALYSLAQVGDLDGIQLILAKMVREGTFPTEESLSSILRGLANSGYTRSIPFLILAMSGSKEAAEHLYAVHKLDMQVKMLPPMTADHFTTAITGCLYRNDFRNAQRILVHMRDLDMEPTNKCLEAIAHSYARLALTQVHGKGVPEESIVRAQSACQIVGQLEEPSLTLKALVTRACAAVGLFADAQEILKTIHREALVDRSQVVFGTVSLSADEKDAQIITTLHRGVLKSAAAQGNVTAALKIVDDIQAFGIECKWGQKSLVDTDEAIAWSDMGEEGTILPPTAQKLDALSRSEERIMGMHSIEWVYVLEAAAKSGHWKVCINTLQFLRPYVCAVHPDTVRTRKEAEKTNAEYKKLSKGLISATKCFEMRSQYGWSVRAISDWIQWSGRRPPKRAVLAAIRILSNRGRSDEVQRLLASCLQQTVHDPRFEGKAYEVTVYVAAITALYKNGLYDAADDLFITAVSSGALPFQLQKEKYGAEKRITLDLHGMNTAVAHSAVRCALQQEVLSTSWNRTDLWDNDLVIVTGRGRQSSLHMRPILRPEVQRMLMEEFYPPLGTVSVPGNMGALRIPAEGVHEWVDHQKQQKGVRMLAMAEVLKGITSGGRIRQAFAKRTTESI